MYVKVKDDLQKISDKFVLEHKFCIFTKLVEQMKVKVKNEKKCIFNLLESNLMIFKALFLAELI